MTYETRPWRHVSDTEIEQCDPALADGWGVYQRADTPDEQGNQLAFWLADFDTEMGAQLYVHRLTLPVTAEELDAALAPPLHPTRAWPYPTTGETT